MQRGQHGFTLLELMVVLVLIGIILTFVVGTVGDGGRRDRIQREAQRINALVEMVGEEAVLQSAVIGLHFDEGGYDFLRFDGATWLPVTGDDLLKPHRLDGMMALSLLVEGYNVPLPAVEPSRQGEEPPRPQAVFLPGGERTPFELTLRYKDDGSGYLLSVPPMGAVGLRQLEGR